MKCSTFCHKITKKVIIHKNTKVEISTDAAYNFTQKQIVVKR